MRLDTQDKSTEIIQFPLVEVSNKSLDGLILFTSSLSFNKSGLVVSAIKIQI